MSFQRFSILLACLALTPLWSKLGCEPTSDAKMLLWCTYLHLMSESVRLLLWQTYGLASPSYQSYYQAMLVCLLSAFLCACSQEACLQA